jgi:RNA polymerase sigma-70 factor, ECF subfamily
VRRPGARLSSLDDAAGDERESHQVADARDGPAQLTERAELARAIERAIGRLRPEYRELASLRYESEMSYEEIAEITGLPIGTVKSSLHRARKAMAGELSAAGWGSRVAGPR